MGKKSKRRVRSGDGGGGKLASSASTGAKKAPAEATEATTNTTIATFDDLLRAQPQLELTPLTLKNLSSEGLFKIARKVEGALSGGGGGVGQTDQDLRYWFLSLLMKYASLDKREWWFIFDDVLKFIASCLRPPPSPSDPVVVVDPDKNDGRVVVIDNFLLNSQVSSLSAAVKEKYQHPKDEHAAFRIGALQDGRDGSNTSTYEREEIRGDYIGWFEGNEEEGWDPETLPRYMLKVNTLISELKRFLDGPTELPRVESRSRAMITCYPGNGARYTKHVDNGGAVGNGRRLTALFYLNMEWGEGDGGELGVYRRGGAELMKEIQPIANRLVLFWSDVRVPHEVLPSNKERYTITIWFFDNEEWAHAKSIGLIPEKTDLPPDDGISNSMVEVQLQEKKENNLPAKTFEPPTFVPATAPDSAREPSGNDLVGITSTNEPFCEPRVVPTLHTQGVMTPTVTHDAIAKAYKVTIQMPALANMDDTELDVKEDRELVVTSPLFVNSPLSIVLESKVDDENVKAKFSKKKQLLTISLKEVG